VKKGESVVHEPFNPDYAWCGQKMDSAPATGRACRLCRKKLRCLTVAAFFEKWTFGEIKFTGSPEPGNGFLLATLDSGGWNAVYGGPPESRKVEWPSVWLLAGKVFLGVLAVAGTVVGIAAGIDAILSD